MPFYAGGETVQIIPDSGRALAYRGVGGSLAERLGTNYRTTPFFVEFHAEGYRCVLFRNGRLLIHGLKDMK